MQLTKLKRNLYCVGVQDVFLQWICELSFSGINLQHDHMLSQFTAAAEMTKHKSHETEMSQRENLQHVLEPNSSLLQMISHKALCNHSCASWAICQVIRVIMRDKGVCATGLLNISQP